MSYTIFSLSSKLDFMSIFEKDFEKYWRKQGSDLSVLANIMTEKKKKIVKNSIKGFMLFEKDDPIGICWVEQVSPFYGDIFFHSIKTGTEEALVNEIKTSGIMNGVLLTVSEMELGGVFSQLFMSQSFLLSPRQRMILNYEDDVGFVKEDPQLTFKHYTKKYCKEGGTLSYLSHQVSQDQALSPDFQTVLRRIELEEEVFKKKFGRIIKDGSLVIFKDNCLVGACVVVENEFWGIKQLPWIFDISIHPDYMGHGFGKQLLHKSMKQIFDWSYDHVGLAVTLSNTSAVSLYDKTGFKFVEKFTEFFYQP